MRIYRKLVRDKIPEIIRAEGRIAKTRILNAEEYREELNIKLQEETKEYLQDNNVEELVDIIEVVYAILNSMNVSVEDFESVRKAKVETRGAFKERVYLEEAE